MPDILGERRSVGEGAPRRLGAGAVLRLIMQPVTFFGLVIVALLWLSVFQLLAKQKQTIEQYARQDTQNIALVVSENAERTASELDRILKYLRETYERNGFKANWPQLVQEGFTVDDQAVQIAVINPKGMMITSSAMLYPRKPVDLSDREHFIVQKNAKADNLFISKPVLGRASGKWSVQFTRRFTNPDGSFAGVIVISLDPAHFAKGFSNLSMGNGNGVALVGDDGVVRSGSGKYAHDLGKLLNIEGAPVNDGQSADGATTLIQNSDNHYEISVERPVMGYPLHVVVTSDQSARMAAWRRNKTTYYLAAGVFSAFVLLIAFLSAVARNRFESKIIHLAQHDQLTGLPNRFYLGNELDEAFSKSETKPFAFCMLDLDGFKSINDTYGHPIGDGLLVAVAQRIRSNLRARDFLSRLGGDEFAVILREEVSHGNVATLAKRLREEIAQPFVIGRLHLNIGVSIGIAFGKLDAQSTADLIRVADLALYNAKGAGRGTLRFFEQEMHQRAVIRRELETGLAEAQARGEMQLYYQPIVSIASGRTTSYEALLRWKHPERGLISPLEFVPLAEETGLIVPIGEWVIRRACEDLQKCSEDISVSVNCSPVQLKSDRLVPSVRQAILDYEIKPTRLRIELTESTLMENDQITLDRLQELRSLGVRVSIDDFGTGYSCLGYLQKYPIDCIKIDRSFVSRLDQDTDSAHLVRAIIAIASSLHMTTVAEGVETERQLAVLSKLGCTEVQGYFFSPPRPAAEIMDYGATATIAA